jgi:hypothetical protein
MCMVLNEALFWQEPEGTLHFIGATLALALIWPWLNSFSNGALAGKSPRHQLYPAFKILLQLKTWAIFKPEYYNIFNLFLDIVIEKGSIFI